MRNLSQDNSNPAEIWSRYLLNKDLECHHYTNLLNPEQWLHKNIKYGKYRRVSCKF